MYRGGQYKLYVYDRYDDVRIAFVPEMQAAFFGGDPDNFNYPRYALDMALLRLYRDGQPAKFADSAEARSAAGPKAGDLIFVSGQSRIDRADADQRATRIPARSLPAMAHRVSRPNAWRLLSEATKGEEEARQASEALAGVENTLKVFSRASAAPGGAVIFRGEGGGGRAAQGRAGGKTRSASEVWRSVRRPRRTSSRRRSRVCLPYQMLEVRFGGGSVLLTDARTLLRDAAEADKPDGATNCRSSAIAPSGLCAASIGARRRCTRRWRSSTSPSGSKDARVSGRGPSRDKGHVRHPHVAEIAADIVANSQCRTPPIRKRLWGTHREAKARTIPPSRGAELDDAAREARASLGADGRWSGIERRREVSRTCASMCFGDEHLSRREVHPAPVLRRGAGLE